MNLRENGFTLLEILIALFILSVGLLGMLRMQVSAIHGSTFSGRMSRAISMAQDRMETLLNTSYDDLTSGSQDPQNGYMVSWTVTFDSPTQDVATIEVTVQWKEGTSPIRLICYKRR